MTTSIKQKAALYDFAIANEFISESAIQREITSQLRSVQATGTQLESLLPAAEEEQEEATEPRASRKRRGRRPAKKASKPAAKRAAATATGTAPISRAKRASRKLQGQYLALIRRFPKSRRAAYSETAKTVSREQAIADMQAELNRADGA